ncbi:unnamed protein product [Peronospora belbahrii]|nr:unnamed protein product [Peronospora belbahrii]
MKYAVLVTGASRGFGRCLTLDFVRLLIEEEIDLHLWARSEHDLKETERLVWTEWKKVAASGKLRCFLESVDLSNPTSYTTNVDQIMLELTAQNYDQVIVVHNAGSLGQLGLAQECISSPTELAKYWELNVTSVLWLNKRFLDVFGASRDELQALHNAAFRKQTQLVIVNITSLCGVKPFKTHMMYCTGKAAREMHHQVVAAEQAAFGKVRVLQYSPGPMDTDMQKKIRESSLVDSELRQQYADMKAQRTLILPPKSSECCAKLAISKEFATGAHVDYYDLTTSSKQV